MISRQTIDRIIDEARIEEVVGDFVDLKKAGSNYKGLSPFTNEKTPSFFVSPAKQIYKCFSTGKGGNAVSFLMELEKYSYPEALRFLAKKYNIEIEEENLTPEKKEELNERESLFIVNQFAQEWFQKQLHDSNEGQAIGLSYFKERGFTVATIKNFGLGYNPDSWEAFTQAARDKGYKFDYLLKTGLVKEGKEGKKYDGYKGRVLFPIHNLSGRVIGFGGRTLKQDKTIPKYVNTPQNEIYDKSHTLYGIYFAKKAIIEQDNCFLVEGYTDVLSMFQSGLENTVASSGTSLTKEQIRLINRFTKNITILYDGDAAGIKASFRGIDLILEQGLNVRVVLFPDGDDPDSYSKKVSNQELKDYIDQNTKDFIVFKTDLLAAETEGDPIKRAGLIHEILNSVALIPDSITRSLYVQKCARILDIAEDVLTLELNKALRKKVRDQARTNNPNGTAEASVEVESLLAGPPKTTLQPNPTELAQNFTKSGVDHKERDLIRILLTYLNDEIEVFIHSNGTDEEVLTNVAAYIIHELSTDELELLSPINKQILDEVIHAQEHFLPISQKTFLHHENPEIAKLAVDLMANPHELHRWKSKEIHVNTESQRIGMAVTRAIYEYKLRIIQLQMQKLQEQIEVAYKSDSDDFMLLLAEQKELEEAKKIFAKQLGITILK